MRDATDLLRDQAWVISALTRQMSGADDAEPVADDEATVTRDGIPQPDLAPGEVIDREGPTAERSRHGSRPAGSLPPRE